MDEVADEAYQAGNEYLFLVAVIGRVATEKVVMG